MVFMLAGLLPCILLKEAFLISYEKNAVDVRTAEIQNQCTILCNQIRMEQDASEITSKILQSQLGQLSNIYDGRIMIIDPYYQIQTDTYDLDTEKTIVSEEVIRCFQGESTTYYDKKERYVEITVPIMGEQMNEVSRVMLVSICTDLIENQKNHLKQMINLAIAVVLLIYFILSFFVSEMLIKPMKQLSASVEEVSKGYAKQITQTTAYTETERLTESFNEMFAHMQKVDSSREKFVSNVSHELKTPLTSMKVLADALLSQPDAPIETYQEFMSDLSEEIERENKIINDLLSLVKLDKTDSVMHISTVNINELIERILKRLRPIAKKQNLEMIFESMRTVTAEVDEMKLSLAITNLVENAIKYNQENGMIHVLLNADHKMFTIEIVDTGIGIPEADQPHIFERFYRVDKSHSRQIGGTGLGLSIARNAVVMHRGSIKLQSQSGQGTTFVVKIPLIYVS